MPEQITLKELQEHLAFFRKMYDVVRLVDPVHKKVLECQDEHPGRTNEVCYAYWKTGNICDNCVSVRAHYENASRMKLEQKPEEIMMVTAIPVQTSENAVVLELFNRAANSMILQAEENNSGQNIYDVIARTNTIAIRDPLTAIYNRRFVDDRLPVDIVKSAVEQKPVSVIYINLDNLKKINDTYGHMTGDLVLKQVSQAIQSCIRANRDWAARYGGVEFLVYLGNADQRHAERVAQRIRERIAAIQVSVDGKQLSITASLGVHTMDGTLLTAEEMIRLSAQNVHAENQSRTQAGAHSRVHTTGMAETSIMLDDLEVTLRQEQPEDYHAVENLTREAFWNLHAPGCDEHYLLHDMREKPCFIPELDIVALSDGNIVGNIVYTKNAIQRSNGSTYEVLTFGPISVLPEYQRRGVGSALIQHTIRAAKEMGYKAILIYGDPAYYSRFGFVGAENFDITTSDDMYSPTLQALELEPGALFGVTGRYIADDVFHVDEVAASEFDKGFPAKALRDDLPSQVRFRYLISHRRPKTQQKA